LVYQTEQSFQEDEQTIYWFILQQEVGRGRAAKDIEMDE
jgi:hypothetical protein